LLLALCLSACLVDDGLGPGTEVCSACSGANDCYSRCYCERESTAQCEQQCGPRGTRVQDLDESEWQAQWEEFESEVVRRTNELREEGGCCGDEGCFPSTPALQSDTNLTRSARAHALDMAEQDYFMHDSRDGRSPFDRMREAGFGGCAMGENIAAGQASPEVVVDGWRDSPGHCANMLSPMFDRIGVGYRPAPGQDTPHVWVQNFGG
jgi:uncharacterized protein YkwD